MGFVIFLVIFTLVLLVLDLYVFKGLMVLCNDLAGSSRTIIKWVYWSISIGVILIVLSAFIKSSMAGVEPVFGKYVVMTLFIVFFTPKLFFAIFHLIEDIIQLISYGANKINSPGEPISRFMFLSKIGLGIMSITLLSNLYGVFVGKFRYKVRSETIAFPNLPKAFDGYKIVQISDIHIGSMRHNFGPMQKAVEIINGLRADLVLFTGDFVNNLSNELDGWQHVFSKIQARDGMFSILGNHDYGDYYRFEDPEEKEQSLNHLVELQTEMGFRLLRNESVEIEKSGEKIDLLGCENWGHRWKQYGDLEATRAYASNQFKILMSHDPSHWTHQVKEKTDIDLTLSGHTHGLQYGIEALGIKWSPIKYAYKNWAGLYNEGKQYLYVNRGLGFVGFLGRVGISPEITEITLKRS